MRTLVLGTLIVSGVAAAAAMLSRRRRYIVIN